MIKKFDNRKRTIIVFVCAILILAVTSYTKVLQGGDSITRSLFYNSEGLVYNSMAMSYDDEFESKYGLLDMYPYNGTYETAFSDETMGFENGYCLTDTWIAVSENEVTKSEYVVGNTLVFFNGDKADIIDTYTKDGHIFVKYDSKSVFSSTTQDSLKYVCVYNKETGKYLPVGGTIDYESQIGLQGMIFSLFPKTATMHSATTIYKWLLAFLYAFVMTFICYGIYQKYNGLFAGTFYVVSLLSPWMIGYSTNLYWVEFTWFLPMLVGIYCGNNIASKKARVISYISILLTVFIKCACGYEFISTIMMGAIVFLLTDLTMAMIEKKDRAVIARLFKTIFIMGICAILGFVLAMICHAFLRGDGDIYAGLRAIYYNDVLRRTFGDPNMFQDVYADSLNASVFRVLLRYLVFKTPIILGVSGILFLPLAMVSFFILVYRVWKKKQDKQMLVLYIWMGITSISWFVLGKSHSYIHTGMNFVMWYFGYIQVVFYVIVQAIWNGIKARKGNETR